MGQSLDKYFTEGNQRREDRIKKIVKEEYRTLFTKKEKMDNFASFFRAVTQLVRDINDDFGYKNQINVPTEEKLRKMFELYDVSKEDPFSRKDFEDTLRKLMIEDGGFMKVFANTELLMFIFGVPIASWLLLKEGSFSKFKISNNYYIPTITSLTAFILAKLNKI